MPSFVVNFDKDGGLTEEVKRRLKRLHGGVPLVKKLAEVAGKKATQQKRRGEIARRYKRT